MSAARPTLLGRFGRNAGPLALLSVLTSVAFNRALFARERSEQHRLHYLQLSLLQQLSKEASSPIPLTSSSLLYSLEEQRKLARRLRALNLDPIRLGFSRDVLPTAGEEERLQQVLDSTTSWSTALFGSGILAKLRQALRRTSDEIRSRGGIGFGAGEGSTSTANDEADEEWLRALEESLDGSGARVSPVEENAAPVKQASSPPVSLREKEEGGRGSRDSSNSARSSQEVAASQPASSAPSTHTERRRRMYI